MSQDILTAPVQAPAPDIAEDVAAWHTLERTDSDIKWARGDIAARYTPSIKQGRGATDDLPTLADFAYQVGMALPRVSEYRTCSLFYPSDVRSNEQWRDLSWTHFNIARRYAAGELGNAEELLDLAVSNHFTSADDFRKFLKERFRTVEDKNPETIDNSHTDIERPDLWEYLQADDMPPAFCEDVIADTGAMTNRAVRMVEQFMRENAAYLADDDQLEMIMIFRVKE